MHSLKKFLIWIPSQQWLLFQILWSIYTLEWWTIFNLGFPSTCLSSKSHIDLCLSYTFNCFIENWSGPLSTMQRKLLAPRFHVPIFVCNVVWRGFQTFWAINHIAYFIQLWYFDYCLLPARSSYRHMHWSHKMLLYRVILFPFVSIMPSPLA